jgi:hypothetical protein
VIIASIPYGKTDMFELHTSIPGLPRRGLIAVVQDVRGRFASEGVFEPFVANGPDARSRSSRRPRSRGPTDLWTCGDPAIWAMSNNRLPGGGLPHLITRGLHPG